MCRISLNRMKQNLEDFKGMLSILHLYKQEEHLNLNPFPPVTGTSNCLNL